MTPAGVAVELARHGARFVIAGDAITLRYPAERPPPADLVVAAREHRGELRALALSSAATVHDLRDGLLRLADGPALAGYSPRAWIDAVAGAAAFSEQWAESALLLGWSPLICSGYIRLRRRLGTILRGSPGCSSAAPTWSSSRPKRQRFAPGPGASCASTSRRATPKLCCRDAHENPHRRTPIARGGLNKRDCEDDDTITGTEMPRKVRITGVDAARIADELGRREPLKLLSSSLKTDKQVVTLIRNSGEEGKKAPPRLRKPDAGED
jgi:hypothetical protein